MGNAEIVVLRAVHIVFGSFWVGTVLAGTFFFFPSARAMGVEGGKYIQRLMAGKYPKVVSSAAGLTLLSGYRLIWIVSGGLTAAWAQSRYGIALLSGTIDATIAFVVGIVMVKKTGEKMAALGAQIAASGQPPTPEQGAQIAAYQKTQKLGMYITSVLLTLTLLAMAVARFI